MHGQPYTATKTLLDYIACSINNWSVERETQVSSNLVLNANVNVYNDTIDGNTNTIVVKYSIDNENWTTIPSSSYSITDNVLTISNLTLNNIIPYTSTTTFYLDISDLLSEAKENYQISKGIETYSWGENDLQVNGTIYIADNDSSNVFNVRDKLVYDVGSNVNGYYIRFNNGIMLCCGRTSSININSGTGETWNITLPQQYVNSNYSMFLTKKDGGSYYSQVTERTAGQTTSGFDIYAWNDAPGQAGSIGYDWMTMGMWK